MAPIERSNVLSRVYKQDSWLFWALIGFLIGYGGLISAIGNRFFNSYGIGGTPFLGTPEYALLSLPLAIALAITRNKRIPRIFLGSLLCIPWALNFIYCVIHAIKNDYQVMSPFEWIMFAFNLRFFFYYNGFFTTIFKILWCVSFTFALLIPLYGVISGFKLKSLREQALSTQVSSTPFHVSELASVHASPNIRSISATWKVRFPGSADQITDTATLKMWARAGVIRPDSFIVDNANEVTYQAKQIPGVFSSKSYTTALLLSFFLGYLGVDRFYLGQTGLGIAKLLTFGGCGIWSLIDFILIAMRKVTDSEGNPLA